MGPEYFPTRHAVEKMADRQITWAEILEVIHNPEVSYRQDSDPRYGTGKRLLQRGKLYVVVTTVPTYSPKDEAKAHPFLAVITCGLRSTLTWNNEDARNRNAEPKETT